nr:MULTISPECIES: hypothetical protein [Pseudomonas]
MRSLSPVKGAANGYLRQLRGANCHAVVSFKNHNRKKSNSFFQYLRFAGGRDIRDFAVLNQVFCRRCWGDIAGSGAVAVSKFRCPISVSRCPSSAVFMRGSENGLMGLGQLFLQHRQQAIPIVGAALPEPLKHATFNAGIQVFTLKTNPLIYAWSWHVFMANDGSFICVLMRYEARARRVFILSS